MRPVGTVVALGAAPALAAARLHATALDCEVLGPDFRRIKQSQAGSLLFALVEDGTDPALAAAVKALRILRKRGGGEALVVLPALEALPGPQARALLQRAAELARACVVQPLAPASWQDAVRCLVEPLTVFGLAGVDAREIHALVAKPRVALLHTSIAQVPRESRDLLVSCRLRPNACLRDLEEAARAAAEAAPRAKLVLAAPEVGDARGPRTLAASFL